MKATVELSHLTKADFEPLIGQAFGLTMSEGATAETELMLREVNSLPHCSTEHRSPFNLLFEGPKLKALPQGMYYLENLAMGKLPIFIVPIKATAEVLSYEAIFN